MGKVERRQESRIAILQQRALWQNAVERNAIRPAFDAPAALGLLQSTGHDLPFIIISGTVVMFGGDHGGGSFQGLATIPEFLWELFLGVYCTIWGFRRDAPILSRGTQ